MKKISTKNNFSQFEMLQKMDVPPLLKLTKNDYNMEKKSPPKTLFFVFGNLEILYKAK